MTNEEIEARVLATPARADGAPTTCLICGGPHDKWPTSRGCQSCFEKMGAVEYNRIGDAWDRHRRTPQPAKPEQPQACVFCGGVSVHFGICPNKVRNGEAAGNNPGPTGTNPTPPPPSVPGWSGNWAKMRVGQRWSGFVIDSIEPGVCVKGHHHAQPDNPITWRVVSSQDCRFISRYELEDAPATPAEKPTCAETQCVRCGWEGEWNDVEGHNCRPPAKTQETRPITISMEKPCGGVLGADCRGTGWANAGQGVCVVCEAALIPKPAPRPSRIVGTAADTLGDMMARHPVAGLAERWPR